MGNRDGLTEEQRPDSQPVDPAAAPADRPHIEGAATTTGSARHPQYETPLRPEQTTIGRLERELGETPAISTTMDPPGTLLSDGKSFEERESHGIIDESRHTSSLGRR
jgi:hypothetical protein